MNNKEFKFGDYKWKTFVIPNFRNLGEEILFKPIYNNRKESFDYYDTIAIPISVTPEEILILCDSTYNIQNLANFIGG